MSTLVLSTHHKLFKILMKSGIDNKDLSLITNLYSHQRATVRIDNKIFQEFTVNRGVRQGYILSPILFTIFSQILFRQALSEIEEDIKINQ